MDAYLWYQQLTKPNWAPPSWLFGPVWSVLYILIAISFGIIYFRVFTKRYPATLTTPLTLNIIFNVIFTPIQFGLRNNFLASVDITLILITLIWCIYSISKFSKFLALIQLPYLFWVSFATILQFSVTFLNL